jgi:hypothetical protein
LHPHIGGSIALKTLTVPNGKGAKIGERSKRLFEKCV